MILPLTAKQHAGQRIHGATQGNEAERKGSNDPMVHTHGLRLWGW